MNIACNSIFIGNLKFTVDCYLNLINKGFR